MLIASIELILVAVITQLCIHFACLVFSVHRVSIAANDVSDQVSLVDEVDRRDIAACPLLQIEEASLDERGFKEQPWGYLKDAVGFGQVDARIL
jgi:hypothetical protein